MISFYASFILVYINYEARNMYTDSDTTRFDRKVLAILGKLAHFNYLINWPVAVFIYCFLLQEAC